IAGGIEGQPGSSTLGGVGGTAGALDGSFRNCQPAQQTSGGGGGGGGGYYGGGGGGGADSNSGGAGGGGAGSSFVIAGGTLETAIVGTFFSPSVTIVPVDTAPVITTGNVATFTVGIFGTFTVKATGYPVPDLRPTGSLPQGV